MSKTDSPAGSNATAGEPSRKKRGKKKTDAQPSPEATANGRADKPAPTGRLASDLPPGEVAWLVKPWFPAGMFSMIVGQPGVGKSTFAAWLMASAGTCCLLPGFEEVVEVMTLPRLVANGLHLRLLRILDDREYRLPRDLDVLARILRGWEAGLLLIDPIDSYMQEEMNENNGKDVRTYLEACAALAKETGAAVVGVRHPGKDRMNVCPGSRQWRAVPRSIAELTTDGGMPPRYMIRHYKDSLGQDARPREYQLAGAKGSPKKFVLKGELDLSLNDLSLVANEPTGRGKVMEAAILIRHMFEKEDKPAVNDLVTKCRELGIGEKARDDAKRLLGIASLPMESGGKWYMVRRFKEWPQWLKDAEM